MFIPPIHSVTPQDPITSLNDQIDRETQMLARSTRILLKEPLSHLLALIGKTLPWICSSHETPQKKRLQQRKMLARSPMVLNKRNPTLRKRSIIRSRAHSSTVCLIRLWIKTKRSRSLGRKTLKARKNRMRRHKATKRVRSQTRKRTSALIPSGLSLRRQATPLHRHVISPSSRHPVLRPNQMPAEGLSL